MKRYRNILDIFTFLYRGYRSKFGLVIAIFTLALTTLSFSLSAHAKSNPRYASIVMDADTGLILHQRYANKSLHPASLTKVMTLLMVFEAIERGEVSLKDRVRISKTSASMVPSKLGLPAGSSIRVKDAIYALVTKSANDVAVALAEHLAGTERNFAAKMTRRARDLGMSRTQFINASGLHHKRQISTARDMAKLARYVIKVHPGYYRYFSRKNFSYNGKSYRNHNRLMDTYDGMDGMKTGYISAAGFNLIASAVRNDRRIIGVVFGGRSSKTRNAHMKELMDMGFNKINTIRIAKVAPPVPDRKPAAIYAMAALDLQNNASSSRKSAKQTGFSQIIGEGDSDPAATARIETGLLAIGAHTKESNPRLSAYQPKARQQGTPANKYSILNHAKYQSSNPWSIQIGAFTTRSATNKAIQDTIKTLPTSYSYAQPLIAPLKTPQGWLFRGRLTGYTENDAMTACTYIRTCLPVAPTN